MKTIKLISIITSLLLVFGSCNKSKIITGKSDYFIDFTSSELVLYVDENTTSFNITIEYIGDYDPTDYVPIGFCMEESTAVRGVHFNDNIDKSLNFKQEKGNTYYAVVEDAIITENITEEVIIGYKKTRYEGEPQDLRNIFKVILRPKLSTNE